MKSTTACDDQLNPDPAVADEASRVVDRLRSSDPQFDDCDDAATVIEGLKADIERYVRINAELATELAKLREQKPAVYANLKQLKAIPTYGKTVLLKTLPQDGLSPLYADPVPALGEAKRLREENERLRKDAERIDWISRQYLDGLCLTLVVDADHDGEYYVAGDDNQTGYGPTLRAAIDAARSAIASIWPCTDHCAISAGKSIT